MLKRIFTLLLSIFIFGAANAQIKQKAITYYKSGLDFKNKNMIPQAMNAFSSAIGVDKKFDSAYVELGHIYLASGKPDEAYANYHQALTINPRMSEALFGTGKIYRDFKKLQDSAIFFFKKAAQIDTANKEIFYGIAWSYNAKEEYDSAVKYGIKALEADNDYKPAYGELAHAYRRLAKYAEAIEQFKKNLAISTVDLALLYSGYCYTELKDKEGATQQYEALNKINEKMASALKRVIDKMQ
ncbi:MAG: tetratricopeptide repeat protein [Ferruginibacter sp.]